MQRLSDIYANMYNSYSEPQQQKRDTLLETYENMLINEENDGTLVQPELFGPNSGVGPSKENPKGKQETLPQAKDRIYNAQTAKKGDSNFLTKTQIGKMIKAGEEGFDRHYIEQQNPSPHREVIFTHKDLATLNALDSEVKIVIQNRMQKEVNYDITNQMKANFNNDIKNRYVKEGLNLILSSPIINTGAFIHWLKNGEGINLDLLKTVGTWRANEVFNEDILEALAVMKGVGVGASQAGPYEHALAMLSSRIELATKGDIKIDDALIELKAEHGRIGPAGWPRGSDARKKLHGLVEKTENQDFIQAIEDIPKTLNHETLHGLVRDYQLGADKRNIISSGMFDYLYRDYYHGLVKAFNESDDYEAVYEELQKTLFNSYKHSKADSDGSWEFLVGFNILSEGGQVNPNGAIAVIRTAEDFVNTPKKRSSPAVIPSGDGDSPRDYQFDFLPTLG
jgi:hypothetical protein